jgi:hypothetical protein
VANRRLVRPSRSRERMHPTAAVVTLGCVAKRKLASPWRRLRECLLRHDGAS